jgi:DNA-binding transcriptional LysR family regulator
MPSYVSEGVGIAMLPGFVVINNKSLAKDCWVINDLNYEGFVSLSWKKSSYKTKFHQLLMDFIVDYYSNHAEPICQSILCHDENEMAPL